jgi:hypothetical protein
VNINWNSHVDKAGSSLDCATEMFEGSECEFPVGNAGSGRLNMKGVTIYTCKL